MQRHEKSENFMYKARIWTETFCEPRHESHQRKTLVEKYKITSFSRLCETQRIFIGFYDL